LKWKDAVEDTEAIRRCLGGERDAFSNLVLRYQTEAVGHATAILGNPEDAREAVQEAFLDAFRALARFDLARRFYPWFYALLRNRCFRLIRVRRKCPAVDLETVVLADTPGVSIEETIALNLALRQLSPEDREIVTLRHLDGLSYQELAERLDIPSGTVMSRLFYARRRLKDLLGGPKERK
jgi:RNA polymerase sigma-70 factor (ECF subfamily)